jgi:hypothetical protein
VSRFPAAFRLPAFASRVILSPLRSWTFLAVGLPDNARTPSGFHVSHARVATGEGALSTPRTAVLTRPIASLRPPPAASQRQCPYTPAEHPSSGAQLDEASLRVHCIHPSGLPLACGPRMERAPLGFLPKLRTPPLPATHVRVGTGLEHWPGTTQSTSSVDPPFYESTRIVRPRVAPRGSCMRPDRHDWERQTGVFGALSGRVAPLGWGNLGAALLDPFEQGAGVAFDLVVAARNRDG